MDEVHSHHFETIGTHGCVGIYREIIIPGFLRWCTISSIRSSVFGVPKTPDSLPEIWPEVQTLCLPLKRSQKVAKVNEHGE